MTIAMNRIGVPEIQGPKHWGGFPTTMVSSEGLDLLGQLPKQVSEMLMNGLSRPTEQKAVIKHFQGSGNISRDLMENPGTFKMLEAIYTGKGLRDETDRYFFNSLSGQALRNRLLATTFHVGEIVKRKIGELGNIKVANLGSGPGRDTIEIFARKPHLSKLVSIDCVDIDSAALQKGRDLAQEKGFSKNFNFVEEDLLKLQYRGEVDVGLLVGVLCGMQHRTCVAVLKRIKRYLKKGGIVIASNVLKNMLAQDPFTSYLLKRVIGWELVYKTPFELQQIFKEAGYRWEGCFFDEPTRFHYMAMGSRA